MKDALPFRYCLFYELLLVSDIFYYRIVLTYHHYLITSDVKPKGRNMLCALLGHKWLYRDMSNHVKADGTKYTFTKVRKCARCDVHQYKFEDWVNQNDLVHADRDVLS